MGGISRTRRIRTYEKKRYGPGDLCLLIENGVHGPRKAKTRGLCSTHNSQLLRSGELEEYARPPIGSKLLGKPYHVKDDPEPGI